MIEEDLKQIRSAVKEEINAALEPIKVTLHTHGKMLESHGQMLESHTAKLDTIWDQVVVLSEDVTDIKDALKSHKRRITALEDHLGITASTD